MALSRFRFAATRHSPWTVHALALMPLPRPRSLAWGSRAARAAARGWHVRSCRRCLHVAPILMPPLLFGGLFVALWTWKCMAMIMFQNTIIYNPFLPPDSRSVTIDDYAKECGRIEWREERIKSLDGTEIALCVADLSTPPSLDIVKKVPVYILYFQGNASSLPPRLPDLSWILRRVRDADASLALTMVCVSYRGYWTSHDRPHERGINLDTEAALQWVTRLHEGRVSEMGEGKPIVLFWGQSIGCGFATNLAAKEKSPSNLPPDALILETPFLSVRAMLQALYPQKWLPYQYLYPFLWNHLDSWMNLGVIAQGCKGRLPGIYMVEAGKDELVPADHGVGLYKRCEDVGLPVERLKVRGALHNEVMVRKEGKDAIARSMLLAITRSRAHGSPPGSSSDLKKE